MKATVNGIEMEGTPDEIAELIKKLPKQPKKITDGTTYIPKWVNVPYTNPCPYTILCGTPICSSATCGRQA